MATMIYVKNNDKVSEFLVIACSDNQGNNSEKTIEVKRDHWKRITTIKPINLPFKLLKEYQEILK